MPRQKNMVVAGISAGAAGALVGIVATNLTATGSTQADALALPGDVNYFTTVASGTGAILPPMQKGDSVKIYNKGANALLVYPPVGGIVNSLSTNAGYSVATATPYVEVDCIDTLTYIASQSA